jgi:phosphoribosylaminoimidazole (AIR) synthetase
LLNIPRMNEKFDYEVNYLPPSCELPTFMVEVMERTKLSQPELCHTFNVGIGLVVATDKPEECVAALKLIGQKAWVIGSVIHGKGDLQLKL